MCLQMFMKYELENKKERLDIRIIKQILSYIVQVLWVAQSRHKKI